MQIPDWVVYAVVLIVIVGTLFSSGSGEKDEPWGNRDEKTQSAPELADRGLTPSIEDSDIASEAASEAEVNLCLSPMRSTSACWFRSATRRMASARPLPSTSPAPG